MWGINIDKDFFCLKSYNNIGIIYWISYLYRFLVMYDRFDRFFLDFCWLLVFGNVKIVKFKNIVLLKYKWVWY